MDLAEWRRLRPPVNEQNYETTPEWAVFHLIEHEAGHAFQISSLKARWKAWPNKLLVSCITFVVVKVFLY